MLWVGAHEDATSLSPQKQQSPREGRVRKCQTVKVKTGEIKMKGADSLFDINLAKTAVI